MPTARDITGLRSGKLTAIAFHEVRNGRMLWLCQCDCGRQSLVSCTELVHAKIQSCGCRPIKPAIKRPGIRHGHRGSSGNAKTPTYYSWASMRNRCLNPRFVDWKYYGGAGVTCCGRWAKFKNFLADMGECPAGMTLDRYPDPAGNYEPGNCRWATPVQQTQNRRKKL
jgi:hypothetical protein